MNELDENKKELIIGLAVFAGLAILALAAAIIVG